MATERPGEGGGETRTTIDALIELLQSKGKLDVNDIAGTLGIAPAIIESWAKVLETGGMVKISYEVGKMFVAPVAIRPEQVKLVETKVEVKRGLAEDKVAAQRSEIEKFAAEINNLSTEVSSLERLYQQRMPAVQQMLLQINTLYDSVIEQGRTVDQIKKTAEDSYQNVNKNIDEMYAKIDALGAAKISTRPGEGATTIGSVNAQDVMKNADAAYEALNSLSSTKDRLFDALLQNVDAQVSELKKQIATKRKEVDAQMKANSANITQVLNTLKTQTKDSKDLAERLKSFKKEIDGTKRLINNSRVQFTDRYEKIKETMRTSSAVLSQDSKAILDKLNDLKAAFGDVVKIDTTLHDARKSITSINKEIEDARESVNDLQKAVQVLGAMTMTLEQRINMTAEIEKKVDESDDKVKKIKKAINDTQNKFHENK
jgi:chromosome segregation ATPase